MPSVDWSAVDDVIYGCANQAGEDNRNVARMALLLAGLPDEVPGTTVNRLCGSSMDAIGIAARAIKSGETALHDRRRRREHDARAVRDGQGRRGVLAQREDRGHDDRLALRQSADEGEVRRRLDARDRRERRGGLQGRRAPTRTPSRCAASSARPRRSRRGASREEIVPVTVAAEERRPARVSSATSIRARPRSRRWPS